MVTHTHSISMHTPNAYSSLQITHPCVFLFALRLLILHHRDEQQLFKETWQWFHPWVPQCEWTWLSETSHLTKCHIRMILWIHGYINDTKCERVRHAWTQSTFLEVHRVFGSVSIVFRENRTKNDGHNNFNWNSSCVKHEGLFQEPHPTFQAFALRGVLLPNRDFYDQPSFFLQFAVRGFFSICHLEECALRGMLTVQSTFL